MRSYWRRRNVYFIFWKWWFWRVTFFWMGGWGSAKRIVFCPQWWGFSMYFPCIFDEFSKSSRSEVIWDLGYAGGARTATFICGKSRFFNGCMGRRQVLWDVAPEKGWFWQQLLPMKKWLEFGLCQLVFHRWSNWQERKGLQGISVVCGYCVQAVSFQARCITISIFGWCILPLGLQGWAAQRFVDR